MKKLFALTAVAAAVSFAPAKADIIAEWTFETLASTNNIIGTGLTPSATQSGVLADIGTGTASASHASSASAWSIPAGNGSGHSWSANNWATGDYFQFSVSTIGFQDVTLSYDQTSSTTGPRDFVLQYSADGVNFFQFGSSYVVLTNAASANNENSGFSTAAWSAGGAVQSAFNLAFDLSSVTALNDAAAVYFRVVAADNFNGSGGAVASAGTDRIDNFIVNATPVPEPETLALVAVGAATVLFSLRRWKIRGAL